MAAIRTTTSSADLIEHERAELMRIHAVVRCLSDVLLHADDDDSVMRADVAQVAARLLDDCVARLELVRVRVAKLEKESAGSAPYQVREPRATYLC